MDVMARLQSCYQAYQAGNIVGAENQYQTILVMVPSASPQLADALHVGSLIAAKAGHKDIGLKRIKQAIAISPWHHEYHNTMGNICREKQDTPAAILAYENALKAKTSDLEAAQNLGKLLIDTNDPVAAIAVYESAVSSHPQNTNVRIGHITALKDAMQSEAALLELDAFGGGGELAYLKGQICFQLSRYDDAIEAYTRALDHEVSATGALKNLLQIHWMRGQWDKGEALIEAMMPQASIMMYLAMTKAYVYANDMEAAQGVLAKGLQKFGNAPYLISERGRLKMNAGDVLGGWTDAVAALTAQAGDIRLMECFADCALAAGHPNHAMVAAHEALKLYPNNQYWIAMKYTAGRVMGQDYRYYADYDSFVKAYELRPPKGYDTIEEFNVVLKKTLNAMHEFSEHPLDQSLRQGTQTIFDLRLVDHPVLKAFFEMLDAPIRAYMDMLSAHPRAHDPMHPLTRRNTQDYRLTGSWSVQLKQGGFHVNHVHPEGWISSAYYVDVPKSVRTSKDEDGERQGWIHFGAPPMSAKDLQGVTLGPEKYVRPKAGTLVLFPSYLWHGTVPLQGDESRMTLPFDVVPA